MLRMQLRSRTFFYNLSILVTLLLICCNPYYRRAHIIKCDSRHWERIQQLSFCNAGNGIISASGSFIYARDIRNGKNLFFQGSIGGDIITFTMSKDQSIFFSSCESDNTVHFSDTGSPMRKKFTGHKDSIVKMIVSADNRYLISAGQDHMLNAWLVPQGTIYASAPTSGYLVRSLTIDDEKNILLSLTADGVITFYSLPDLSVSKKISS